VYEVEGWAVNVVACGVADVKRVKVSDGGRREKWYRVGFMTMGDAGPTCPASPPDVTKEISNRLSKPQQVKSALKPKQESR
jgi:hypothetical protein